MDPSHSHKNDDQASEKRSPQVKYVSPGEWTDEPDGRIERSCGCVVYRPEQHAILLIKQRGGGQRWCIPKGHIEEGETPEQCAQRETFEETGILPDGDLMYVGQTVTTITGGIKYVDIFMSIDSGTNEPEPMPGEAVAACFWPLNALPEIVGYQQRLVAEVKRAIEYAIQSNASASA